MSAKVAKQTGFNFLTIACNAFSSLILTAVIARWLGPTGMGTYSLVTWFFTIAGILVNLGFITTIMKYMAEALGRNDHEEASGTLAFGVKQLLLNGGLVTLAWCAVTPWASQAYSAPELRMLMPIAAFAILPASLMALLMAACQGLQRYGVVALATGVYTASMVVGTLAALALGFGIAGLLGVMSAASLLACGVYAHAIHKWQPGWMWNKVSDERRATLRKYSRSLMVLILLDAIVWQRSGVFFLGLWSPSQEVAFYAMAFGLATMAMRMIPGTLVGLLIPSMSRSFGSGDMAAVQATYHTAGRWMAMLAVPVAVGGGLLAGPLVTTLYGATYAPMAPILAVLLLSGALVMTFGFPASSVLYAVEGQRFLVMTGFGVAVANLIMAVLLIPTHGALGAAWATAISQALSLIPGAYFAGKMLGGALPSVRRLPAVLAAAAGMAVPVWAIAHTLPPIAALLVGVPVGGMVYALGLKLFNALEPEDWARVHAVAARLPVVKRWVPAAQGV